MGEKVPGRGPGILGYFGLETGEKAGEMAVWSVPYLGLLVAGLLLLSWLVQKINPLPFWIYCVAIVLAIAYFFLFLARVKQMGVEAQAAAEQGQRPAR